MNDFVKLQNDLNGLGGKVTAQEIKTECQSVKIGYIESAVRELKLDISNLFDLVTNVRLETKALTTRGFLIQSIVLIFIQVGIALWLKS